MKLKKKKGSALYQYVIIIALVALALVPVLMALGNITNQSFESYLSFYTTMSKNVEKNAPTIKTGSLGGTSTNPVSQCNAGTCDIDFGDYLLTGVPENFQSLVQTSGTSGGVEQLADIFAQLAEQIKTEDPEGYKDYMRFSNLVHLQANILKHVENKIESSADTAEFQDFYYNATLESTGFTIPPELADALPNFDMTKNIRDQGISNELGMTRYHKINTLDYYNDQIDKSPGFAIVDLYDKIMSDTKYSENLKSLTQELYLNIADLSFNSKGQFRAAAQLGVDGNSGPIDIIDPITGAEKDYNQYFTIAGLDEALHPKYSLKDDLNGALVCTAGKNIDTGKSCHQ